MKLEDAKIDRGLRLYAIGDVHGCVNELRSLLDQIQDDLERNPIARSKMIFVGDYVDRGPANFETVSELIALRESGQNCIFLRGNHDNRVLEFLDDPDSFGAVFLKWGGEDTLRDYGVSVPAIARGNYREIREELRESLPEAHLDFFRGLEYSYESGDFFFCHGGVKPGVPLNEQDPQSLMTIRSEFLDHDKPFEKMIVHGHTPQDDPEVKSNRINVDTHCYSTGRLTALVLEAGDYRFLQT